VPTRLLTLACAVGVLAAACSTVPKGTVDPGSGRRFLVQVADSVDDVGLGNAIALDKDGVPFLSYWGFKQEVTGIPVARPVGAPFIPAVQIASQGKNGIWTRGAAAQVPNQLQRITVPYGPATVKSLKNATAADTNGTDIAIGSDGTMHVVWTAQDGVYYASGSGSSFTVTRLYEHGSKLEVSGPIGRPSVAVDANGTPWVAYIVNAEAEEVRVATPDPGGKWRTTVVDTLSECGVCFQPGVAQIGVTDAGPVVAFADSNAKAIMVATSHAGGSQGQGVAPGTTPSWTTERAATGVRVAGLDLATGAKGAIYLSYYTGSGTVELASSTGSGWTTAKVGNAPPSTDQSPQGQPETTGVAADDKGSVSVAWYDGKSDAVVLASGDGSTFAPVATPGTEGGRYPSLAVAPDGSETFLAWYVNKPEDLRLGIEGTLAGQAIAYPSPTPSLAPLGSSPSAGGECGADKKVVLDVVAQGIAWTPTCLVAAADADFTVNIDDKDPIASTGQHDLAIYKSATDLSTPIAESDPINGPATATLDVKALKAGTYFFQCTFHPQQMQGTFAVVAGAR
jgi:hypothetical protein